MKSLIAFYTVCILMFYTLIAYIGNRENKYTRAKTGLLEDIALPSADYKITKAKLLSQNFDNALIYSKMNESKLASTEIYKALQVLAASNNSSQDNYDTTTLDAILKNLSICYINLANGNESTVDMNKVFESSELFIAYGFIKKSRQEIKHKKNKQALESINKAQECLALSAKYVNNEQREIPRQLLKSTQQLESEIALANEQ